MTRVTYFANGWTCLEDIDEKLVVGHAVQLGQFCQGELYFHDFDYECGPGNQFLFLDQNGEAYGDRFTCLETTPIHARNVPALVSAVSIRTDWRVENGDLTSLIPCEGFEDASVDVAEATASATNNVTNSTEATASATNNVTNSTEIP